MGDHDVQSYVGRGFSIVVEPVETIHQWFQERPFLSGSRRDHSSVDPGETIPQWIQERPFLSGSRRDHSSVVPGETIPQWIQERPFLSGSRRDHSSVVPGETILQCLFRCLTALKMGCEFGRKTFSFSFIQCTYINSMNSVPSYYQ